MSPWLIALVGVIYIGVSADLARRGMWWDALVYFGFAVSNVGLWKIAQRAMQ